MPLDDRIVELINTVTDGEATAAERAELEDLLGESPEAQRAFGSAREVAEHLDSAARVEPPNGMRAAIMNAVVARAGRTVARTARSAPARRRAWFGLAWAAVAAIVVAVVAIAPIHLISRRSTSNSGATMAPHVEYDWPVVATIESKTSTARLIVRRDGELLLLEPVIDTRKPAVISLAWDPSAASTVAFSGGGDASSSKGQLTFSLRPTADRGSVIVRPRPGLKSLEVTVSVDSRQLIRAVVPLR